MPLYHEPAHRMRSHRALLENREPALINLPVSIPDVPLLSPLLTPLIAGENQQATATATPTLTSPPSSSPSSDTGDSSESNSGSDDSTSGGSDDGGSGGNSGGSSAGGGSSANNGSGSIPTTLPSGSSPSSGASSGQSSKSSGSGAASATSSAGGVKSSDLPGGGGLSSSSSLGSNGGSGSVASGFPTAFGGAVVNVGGAQATPSLDALSGEPSSAPDGTMAYGGTNTGDTSDGDSPTSTDGSSPSPNTSGALSTGGIVAIVVVLSICLLALLLFFVRRRYRSKRSERSQWWFSNMSKDNMQWGTGPGSQTATAGTASVRSSFATTYDFASPSASFDHSVVPMPPPMVEVRDTHTPGMTLQKTPILVNIEHTTSNDTGTGRVSVYSQRSMSSDPYSQFLVVREPENGKLVPEIATPMSVRPFTPSESFAFPQPPPKHALGDLSMNGFNGGTADIQPDSPVNPFADIPVRPLPTTPVSAFEIICRPFSPTLHDELAVDAGDRVTVLKVFDDGWALVEKAPIEDRSGKGKGKAVPTQPGLIPIDCLREAGQPLPAFLAAKRVSSYATSAGAAYCKFFLC